MFYNKKHSAQYTEASAFKAILLAYVLETLFLGIRSSSINIIVYIQKPHKFAL